MFNKKIEKKIFVDGMSCNHCANKVKSGLENIEGIKKVSVDLNKKEVTIFSNKDIDVNDIKTVVEDLGYKFLGE